VIKEANLPQRNLQDVYSKKTSKLVWMEEDVATTIFLLKDCGVLGTGIV
jgi:hypothetical protein